MCLSPKLFILVIFFLILNLVPAISQSYDEEGSGNQDLSKYIREKHGPDQAIINGTLYYNKYYRVLNHPYYTREETHRGTVVLSGKRFMDVKLNYDIYGQYLVLEYQKEDEVNYMINLSPVLTDAFSLDDYYFEKIPLNEEAAKFYQVINVKGISCYIHWKKELLATTNNTQHADFFSDPDRTYFLDFNENISQFKNRKSFASRFPDIPKGEIYKYKRQNNINFRMATPEQIESLLMFLSSKIQAGS